MIHDYNDSNLSAQFCLTDELAGITNSYTLNNGLISIVWNRSDHDVSITVDDIPMTLASNQITTTTYLQKISFSEESKGAVAFLFNRAFYCIQDHDHEVSCNGILFFGTQDTPVVSLNEEEAHKIELLYQVFIDEFGTRDNIQGEMLRMLLKRLIIKVTRLAKQQLIPGELDNHQIDLIRKFNVLVDLHYRTKRQVADYADLLNKSPKTLSNLFSMYNKEKTPLQIIHERIVLESKRLLTYTAKTSKEIAYDLGFDDVTAFNKLFKKVTGCSPSNFKKTLEPVN
ncbi:MAG: helix-turn-helix domain-containing protein [bacterium]|nr:helix-turn-helix domain-containing protein [bacterium]